jgi:hypothetical protein
MYNGRHASNHAQPSRADASPLFMVRRRVRHRPPSGPSSPLLQSCLPPTCVRTSTRIRAPAHGPAAAGSGRWRRLVGLRLRAWRVGRSVRQSPCHAHQRETGGSSSRDVVRGAGTARHGSVLHTDAPPGLSNLHDGRRFQSAAIRHQPVERALSIAITARRHRRAAGRPGQRSQVDSGKLPESVGVGLSGTNTCSR